MQTRNWSPNDLDTIYFIDDINWERGHLGFEKPKGKAHRRSIIHSLQLAKTIA